MCSLIKLRDKYKHVPQHFKLQNHNYCLRTDIDNILPAKLNFFLNIKFVLTIQFGVLQNLWTQKILNTMYKIMKSIKTY